MCKVHESVLSPFRRIRRNLPKESLWNTERKLWQCYFKHDETRRVVHAGLYITLLVPHLLLIFILQKSVVPISTTSME